MKTTLLAATLACTAVTLAACGGGGSSGLASPSPGSVVQASNALSVLDDTKVPTSAEATTWLTTKDNFGPAYAGSQKYDHYIAFLEEKMRSFGLVDFTRYTFPYPFWQTSEWPDKSGWSLVSNGTKLDVASYAVNSGNTGASGVTGQMVLYDLNVPAAQRPTAAQMKGKIVVIRQQLYSTVTTGSSLPDYEFRTSPEAFPIPINQVIPASVDADFRNRQQLSTATTYGANVCAAAGGLAAIWVLDMSPLAAQGARQHGTPKPYNCPGVLVDRNVGASVVADAAAGKTATVTLNATITSTRPAQIVAYLPGKNYGKPNDQKLLMITHTDGPSNVEDNGSLGILGVLRYFSQIPQEQRQRTIMVYLDNRHFVAGAESSYPFDYFEDFPDAANGLVGGLAMEHFGGMQFAEVGDDYKATGWPAHTNLFSFPNPMALDLISNAAKDMGLRRGVVSTPTATGLSGVYSTTGANGQDEGFWYGPGFMSPFVDNGRLPAWHVSGDWPSAGYQAYYPAVGTRVDPEYYRTMVKVSIRLMQALETEDLTKLAPDWGIVRTNLKGLADASFQAGVSPTTTRSDLLTQFDAIYALVRTGDYANVSAQLPALRAKVQASLTAAAATNPLANVDRVIALAQKGANLPN
jgi:hypothetical protein